MERPISIVWFERCYLGGVAIGVFNTALSWNAAMAKMAENPASAQLGASFGSSMLIFGTVIGLAINALLWFFTARKGSVVTKWIITVFFALGLLGMLFSVMRGALLPGIGGFLAIVALVLNGIAVWQLFKPDTKLWFGEVKA